MALGNSEPERQISQTFQRKSLQFGVPERWPEIRAKTKLDPGPVSSWHGNRATVPGLRIGVISGERCVEFVVPAPNPLRSWPGEGFHENQ